MKLVPITQRMTKKTFFQSLILGVVGGPIIFAFQKDHSFGEFAWCIVAMALAPIIVDAIRPTYTN